MNKPLFGAVADLVVHDHQAKHLRILVDALSEEFGAQPDSRLKTLPRDLEFGIAGESMLLDVFVQGLATSMKVRDVHTSRHNLRTRRYIRELAMALRGHPDFGDALDDATISLLSLSATLHDIGKLAIPDSILLKPAKLEPHEFEIMKSHPMLGYQLILGHELSSGFQDTFMRHARDIAYSHHERWDGLGYPLGLKGEEIPLSARLMAVVDVYDALVSVRAYKTGMTHAMAIELMANGSDTQFDARILAAFIGINHVFAEIAQEFQDTGTV